MSNRVREWLLPLVQLCDNVISLAGVVLVTSATVLWIFLLPSSLGEGGQHPYLGILAFLVLPGAFFAGLGLIPLGGWLQRRMRGAPALPATLDFRNPALKRLAAFVAGATVLNVGLASQFTYSAVSYMDGVQFCGQTCHTVMKPEFTAYQNSPHSRVECVKCHIGPGASWFVKSKLSGLRQVYAVAFDTHDRPIQTPIPDLRPARETCEACHWPQKYGEDRIRVTQRFAEDEQNTASRNVLMMRIGKIHRAHQGEGVRITYRSDAKREIIPWVEYTRNGGDRRVYLADKAKAEDIARLELRELDCMDCHNRPSHSFQPPEFAVDAEMSAGGIPASLPFAKKTALAILKQPYASTAEAHTRIPDAWRNFYQTNYPAVARDRSAEIDAAGRRVLALFDRNVFPEMKVQWGTYPNHIGHNASPGCFRCHDERPSGTKTLSQDCNTCHQLLAMEEKEPKILSDLGWTN